MRIYMLSPLWTVFDKKLKILLVLVLLPIFHYCNGTKSLSFCPGWEKPACPHYFYLPQPPLQLLAAPLPKAPTSPPSSNAGLLRLRLGRLVGELKRPIHRLRSAHACSARLLPTTGSAVGSVCLEPHVKGNKGRPRVLLGQGVSSVRTHTNSTRLLPLQVTCIVQDVRKSGTTLCMLFGGTQGFESL